MNYLRNLPTPILVALSIASIWIIAIVVFWVMLPNWEERGQFGDMFGAINALFAGLAFFGVLCAIFLQRNELELTRNELKGQKEQLANQNETMLKQNLENTFFQLLRPNNEIVSSIEGPLETKGRDAFPRFLESFRLSYGAILRDVEGISDLEAIREAYKRFFKSRGFDVGHYYRHLYNILKFISDSNIDQKELYGSFMSAQLSSGEQLLLFYHCLSEFSQEQFKQLVEDHSMLQSMRTDQLLSIEHVNLYSPSAFSN